MVNQLIKWSKKNYSHLPWRQRRSLYNTLVSEIMLQQTTVGTVLNHFNRFVQQFPDIDTLSNATEEQMLIAWKGLGYYRRARNLLKVAKTINVKHNNEIPLDYDTLISIPGIGPYTANAILAIGDNRERICLDANLERVLSRMYQIDLEKGPILTKHLYGLFEDKKILNFKTKVSFRELNEALMDVGRVYCQAKKADCLQCPLSNICQTHLTKSDPLLLPKMKIKKTQVHELNLLRIIKKRGNKVLAYKKNDSEWLSGQYELPTFIINTCDKNLIQYPKLQKKISLDKLESYKTAITKYKILNFVKEDVHFAKGDYQYLDLSTEIQKLSTASLKALKLMKII